MNRSYLGAGARGFEAASQRYFGKSAMEVNASEAAMLAGLLKAPSYYAPTNNLQRATSRANLIVGLMQEQGFLTQAEAQDAIAHPAQLSEAAQSRSGGFFADWVMETTPDYLARDTTEDVIIETTLDQTIQKQAEEALAWVFENKVKAGSKAQAAIVVMSADGAVRGMVGGRDLPQAGDFNRATQALRSSSVLKMSQRRTALRCSSSMPMPGGLTGPCPRRCSAATAAASRCCGLMAAPWPPWCGMARWCGVLAGWWGAAGWCAPGAGAVGLGAGAAVCACARVAPASATTHRPRRQEKVRCFMTSIKSFSLEAAGPRAGR